MLGAAPSGPSSIRGIAGRRTPSKLAQRHSHPSALCGASSRGPLGDCQQHALKVRTAQPWCSWHDTGCTSYAAKPVPWQEQEDALRALGLALQVRMLTSRHTGCSSSECGAVRRRTRSRQQLSIALHCCWTHAGMSMNLTARPDQSGGSQLAVHQHSCHHAAARPAFPTPAKRSQLLCWPLPHSGESVGLRPHSNQGQDSGLRVEGGGFRIQGLQVYG